MRGRAAAALLIAAAVLLAACGGDDTKSTPIAATLAGTKADTPTPAPTEIADGGGSVAPDPAGPQLDEQLTEVGSGESTVAIESGDSRVVFDPASDVPGDTSCDNFQYAFTWQVTDPWPPDGVALEWHRVRSDSDIVIASGASGEQSVGCDTISAVNNGPTEVTVATRYVMGGIP